MYVYANHLSVESNLNFPTDIVDSEKTCLTAGDVSARSKIFQKIDRQLHLGTAQL